MWQRWVRLLYCSFAALILSAAFFMSFKWAIALAQNSAMAQEGEALARDQASTNSANSDQQEPNAKAADHASAGQQGAPEAEAKGEKLADGDQKPLMPGEGASEDPGSESSGARPPAAAEESGDEAPQEGEGEEEGGGEAGSEQAAKVTEKKKKPVTGSLVDAKKAKYGAFSSEPFIYTDANKRNPFRPPDIFLQREQSGGGRGLASDQDVHTVLLPLQRFSLSQIKLIGIMWDVETPQAMVEDPEGTIHTIGINTRIGNQKGVVASIRESEVLVLEKEEVDGELISRLRRLALGRRK